MVMGVRNQCKLTSDDDLEELSDGGPDLVKDLTSHWDRTVQTTYTWQSRGKSEI